MDKSFQTYSIKGQILFNSPSKLNIVMIFLRPVQAVYIPIFGAKLPDVPGLKDGNSF